MNTTRETELSTTILQDPKTHSREESNTRSENRNIIYSYRAKQGGQGYMGADPNKC